MENKSQKPWEPNIEWINKQNFSVDIEDPIYKQILESEEESEEDAEIVHMLKSNNFVEISDNLKERVMTSYRKEYVYRIAWHNIKTKIMQYKGSLFDGERRLEVVLASIVILFVLSIAYYQYTKANNSTNIIAGQETPIKVSPNPTDTPISTPSPIETISPNITKDQEKNRIGLGQSDNSENNQQILQAKKKKTTKPKLLDGEQIALLRAKHIDLLSVETVYVSEKINMELREELNSLLRTIDRFKVIRDSEIISTQPDATFQFSPSDSRLIVLQKKALNVAIWEKPVNTTLTPKDQARWP